MPTPQEKLYNQYPDTDGKKEVSIYIDTRTIGAERHVYIAWKNGEGKRGDIYQILHLTGGPGNYSFYARSCREISQASVGFKNKFFFGECEKATRDTWVSLAAGVAFDKKSTSKNCQDWMRNFLGALVTQEQITEQQKKEALEATIDKAT